MSCPLLPPLTPVARGRLLHTADFIREVIGGQEPVVLVGNSLGGYNALATAARNPDLVK